jgi:hypothetical protein
MNKLVRSAVVGAVSLAAVGVATLGVASPAQAALADGVCDSGESCIFKNHNYGGGMADMNPTDSYYGNNTYSSGGSAGNSAGSGFGHDRAVQYYNNKNYAGEWFILGVNQYDAYWTTYQPNTMWPSFNFNDKVSSSVVYVP